MIRGFRVPVILMYHSVREARGGSIYRTAISPDRFDRHIAYLTSCYRILPLTEFVAALTSLARTDGIACVTFDDGFADNLGAAREILCKYHCPATVLVPTGFVDRRYFWWDVLPAIIQAAREHPESVEAIFQARLPGIRLSGAGGAPPDPFTSVWDRLRRLPLDDVYQIVEELATRCGIGLNDLPRPATSTELRELSEWPFEIGAHAISHRPLPALSLAEAKVEIESSRACLESHTGRPVRTLSYPFGLSDRDVAVACRDAGYLCAVGVARYPDYPLSYIDAFNLPRLDAADGDVDELRSLLGDVGDRNIGRFVTRGTCRPEPVSISPERRHNFASVQTAVSSPAQFRGGDFFRVTPVSRVWGCDRGTPLDRPYIDRFIQTHAGDLHGRILEIKQAEYAAKHARAGSHIDILDIDPTNTEANVIDDLQTCTSIADETYDCLILTQVLQLIPDVERAVATAARILRPGGTLLLTAPGITQAGSSHDGEFLWSFFGPGLKRALSAHFDPRKLLVHSHGNVGLAAAFLMGLAVNEVPPDLFSAEDPEYPIVLTARALKPLPVPSEIHWTRAASVPDISVIIPMFNAERTIRGTLFSVSRQSHDSYEILVIDDGSTDASRRIVEETARASQGRITVLQHADNANRGLSKSRNLGLRHACGEFVVFLDADDTIHSEKFAHDIAIVRAHPEIAAVVGRALWWWDGKGEQDAHLDMVFEPANRVLQPPEFFDATYETQAGGVPPCVHSWMVRKSALEAIEPFDPYVLTYEDQKFLAELTLRFPIYVAATCLCEYRRREETLWASAVTSGTDPVARARFVEWKTRLRQTATAYLRSPKE